MARIQPLIFPSIISVGNWANNAAMRLGDAWYVQKDGLYYYFGAYSISAFHHEFRLVMVSEKNLGD